MKYESNVHNIFNYIDTDLFNSIDTDDDKIIMVLINFVN